MDDPARHHWVATHILPHEGEVRGWLRRRVRTLDAQDIDDLMQEAYSRLWTAEYRHVANGVNRRAILTRWSALRAG